MNSQEERKSEERRQQFKAILTPCFPTIGSVISLSDETRKAMKEENKRKRIEAERKRAEKRAKR